MYMPNLVIEYDQETNTGKSLYQCGETEEEIWYEGSRGDKVKFTPTTWPEYLAKLYGKSLPVLVAGYGYIKYVEDAIAIGVPEQVYTPYNLRSKNDPKDSKVMYICYERRDYDGNLLERKVLFDEYDDIWYDAIAGSVPIPQNQDPTQFTMKMAEDLLAASNNAAQ